MGCETKLSIQNTVCAKFDLESLKSAREVLYKAVNPNDRYVYNGPKSSSTDSEKAVHALEGILTKLQVLDKNASSIVFACPSYDLACINPSNGNTVSEDIAMFRMNRMEQEIGELKSMKSQIADLQNTVITMITSSNGPHIKSANPSRDKDFPVLRRDRSSSTVSNKRARGSDSDLEIVDPFGDDDGFRLARSQRKKVSKVDKKQKLASPTESISYAEKMKNGTPKTTKKKQFQWGKLTEDSSTGFKGLIPDLFITRCSVDTEIEHVTNHLKNKGITIKKIEKKSREDASFKSFKISVNSSKDYDNILSGDPLPPRVQVRQWIYYKKTNNESTFRNAEAELDRLEKDIFNPPHSNVSEPASGMDVTTENSSSSNP